MSSSELLEWMDYFKIEPPTADRTERQLAILTMANVKAKNMKLQDYMVTEQPKPRESSLENKVKSIFGGF